MENLKILFAKIQQENPESSLDELLYKAYQSIEQSTESFSTFRSRILEANNIDEYEYYTKNVDSKLKKYVEEKVFPEYEKNDKAHGIIHILEVIRRSFALNATLKLGLEDNKIYAIAAFHDLGKYIDHENHEKIAASLFMEDPAMPIFFNEQERTVIKEAIEDHRSSKEDTPRSDYGKLISSADRNTRIEIVFIRSFFVGKWRTPEREVEDFLDYTYKRLSKRYGEENPENMFFEDETYRVFLNDMRALLQDEINFKRLYCEVNHISNREHTLSEEKGETTYFLKRN
ncbi:MAG: HD domain-containing protein [Bacilli bacterium]|nr:HD domain-containing protein [Bacilli bacterium]